MLMFSDVSPLIIELRHCRCHYADATLPLPPLTPQVFDDIPFDYAF